MNKCACGNHVLKGLLRCGHCGAPTGVRPHNRKLYIVRDFWGNHIGRREATRETPKKEIEGSGYIQID